MSSHVAKFIYICRQFITRKSLFVSMFFLLIAKNAIPMQVPPLLTHRFLNLLSW